MSETLVPMSWHDDLMVGVDHGLRVVALVEGAVAGEHGLGFRVGEVAWRLRFRCRSLNGRGTFACRGVVIIAAVAGPCLSVLMRHLGGVGSECELGLADFGQPGFASPQFLGYQAHHIIPRTRPPMNTPPGVLPPHALSP